MKRKFFLHSVIFLFIISLFYGYIPAQVKKTECKNVKVTGHIKEYGLARGDLMESGIDRTNPTETYADFSNIKIIEKTNRVPVRDGNMMYFTVELDNLPEGREVQNIRIQSSFPQIKNPNGKKFTGNSVPRSAYKNQNDKKAIIDFYWAFLKEYPYEMVEGKWTFQVYYKECELTRIEFYGIK